MPSRAKRFNMQATAVLLVDDNKQSLELLTQILTGFRVGDVKAAHSAEKARGLLDQQRFDLFMIDADMPGEDGVSFTLELRAMASQPHHMAPILLLSAFTPMHRVAAARDAGANMVIKKPIAPGVLLSRIEWLARENRQFIACDTYRGPDRRFKNVALPPGVEERRADAIALAATPDRELAQDDIDALFN